MGLFYYRETPPVQVAKGEYHLVAITCALVLPAITIAGSTRVIWLGNVLSYKRQLPPTAPTIAQDGLDHLHLHWWCYSSSQLV